MLDLLAPGADYALRLPVSTIRRELKRRTRRFDPRRPRQPGRRRMAPKLAGALV